MLEITPQMSKPVAAVVAQPARVIGSQVIVDGYDVHWNAGARVIHCWLPEYRSVTAADFRKFASIFNEIADTLSTVATPQEDHHG